MGKLVLQVKTFALAPSLWSNRRYFETKRIYRFIMTRVTVGLVVKIFRMIYRDQVGRIKKFANSGMGALRTAPISLAMLFKLSTCQLIVGFAQLRSEV